MGAERSEKDKVKSLKDYHFEIIKLYIKDGLTQQKIADKLGLKSNRDVSSVIRAYNFEGGKDREKYRNVSVEQIQAFVDAYSPGFFGEAGINFSDFIKSKVPRCSREEGYDEDVPFQREYTNGLPRESISSSQHTYDEANTVSMYFNIFKLVLPLVVLYFVYKGITGWVVPTIKEGFFKSSILFQKQADIATYNSKKGTYFGELAHKKPDGYGSIMLADGKMYTGTFEKGNIVGQGVMWDQEGARLTYIGGFGKRGYQTLGILNEIDGSVYIGEFKNGKKYGVGAFKKPGDYIWSIGNYKNDVLKKTYATVESETQEVTIEDMHNYEVKHAPEGIVVGEKGSKLDGLAMGVCNEYLSVGFYKKGVPKGPFIQLLSDGDTIYGINDDKWIRDAIRYQVDGSIVMGAYKNGGIEGYGMECMSHGDSYIGNYKNGERHGKGTYIFSDQTRKQTVYNKGQLVE